MAVTSLTPFRVFSKAILAQAGLVGDGFSDQLVGFFDLPGENRQTLPMMGGSFGNEVVSS